MTNNANIISDSPHGSLSGPLSILILGTEPSAMVSDFEFLPREQAFDSSSFPYSLDYNPVDIVYNILFHNIFHNLFFNTA